MSQDAVDGAKDHKRIEQQNNGLIEQHDKDVFDVYYHFEQEGEKWFMYVTNGNCSHLHTKKKINKSPFAFFYWEPNGSFYGNRPANN